MPTVITHSIVSGLLGKSLKWEQSGKITLVSFLCGSIPDLDVIGKYFGIAYGDVWGHRGMSHSICFAAGLSLFFIMFLSQKSFFQRLGWWLYFTLLISTHGLLDMCTTGGKGVAILGPWSEHRHFFPHDFKVIKVSPMATKHFTWERLRPVFESELYLVILPMISLFLLRFIIQKWIIKKPHAAL